ncbi:hypothetical protein DNFV4_00327 [Nitrospira tepida]|uniref:Uncharacterized protein n=1 Tax=Nitrospira tepida TaxID=2973512 RepID=A0AA86MVU1_9BACT|nr:hypothetical protein [Nitrospira tepida]CAI4029907.1 hypothetical protein DNFV4_00327 [Nitrospira tepida]
MNCPRCQGLMVEDHFIDLQESMGPHWVTVMRCMNCGNVVDPGIAVNRLWAETSRTAVARSSKDESVIPQDARQAA